MRELAEHPFVTTELTDYVDGRLDPSAAATIDAHLRVCAVCAEDVEDLRASAALLAPRRRTVWPLWAAAAAVAIGIGAMLFVRRDQPETAQPVPPPRVVQSTPPPPPAPVRAEWREAVDDAMRRGSLAMPAALAALQLPPDPERAPAEQRVEALEPAAAIVESTRPPFRWTDVRGATYVVSIFEGTRPIAESPVLREPHWQPERDLIRGRTYQWQVSVRVRGERTILPAPPAPPALFRVLDEQSHEELERARAERGSDPLLLGVLYAREGLRAEAERELGRVATEEGRRLLRSVQEWPR
jgi:Putative zinc-finger